jgi:hypothetical protein
MITAAEKAATSSPGSNSPSGRAGHQSCWSCVTAKSSPDQASYTVTSQPGPHDWYYLALMRRDETLGVKVFDTNPSTGVHFTAHTAFDDP